MLLRITEQSHDYVKSVTDYLVAHGAATTTEEPTVIEVSDNFPFSHFHGLERALTIKPFHVEFADVVDWLKQYNGTFGFYLSLKSQLATKGSLSVKQIDSVRRAISKASVASSSSLPIAANAAKATVYSLKPGDIIVVSKWLAREIGEKAGVVRPHYTLEVVKVDVETDRAYRATLMLSGQRTSHCGICGIKLTDPKSVTAGIGPICAEKVGVSFTEGSLEELKESLKVTGTVNTWFPKSSIKEKITKETV